MANKRQVEEAHVLHSQLNEKVEETQSHLEQVTEQLACKLADVEALSAQLNEKTKECQELLAEVRSSSVHNAS